MFEFLRYDGRKRLKGSLYLTVGMALLVAVIVWVFPSFRDTFEGDELLEAYPPEILQLFDIQTMASLEGFLAFELYVFGWVILLGLYFAYSAASVIADDVDRGRMDSLLAMPVSRPRLLAERFAALGVPILMVNLLVPPVVLAGAWLIDESLSVADVFAVHLLSVPYLFACAGIGILCSVAFDRVSIAQRVALGATFALFLVESMIEGTDYEPVGAIAPMRYYDPNEILLESSYDLTGAAVLIAMTVALVVLSQLWFVRKDI
ncbi:ABC transporter permease subunit [Natrononativus amylolyticus]|uniref:ABC transporter permease subunit n=1 Tax=Natrononativus amylolyticus TaxID=2963434 RepID=UPI0020CE0016|nr:ABC transporter permease subunit [Natrononativus amylolyticus]